MIECMKKFQVDAVRWLNEGYRGALFADMGTGKTCIALTHLTGTQEWPALVISTKRVVELVWEQEAQKWYHLSSIKFSRVTGTAGERRKALDTKAQMYLINIENIQWLMEQPNVPRFKVVILDELSLWRKQGKRWKAVRDWLADVNCVIGLTGTPASNGYEGLWPQMELINPGTLFRTQTLYRQRYFWQHANNPHRLMLRPGADEEIQELMTDHVHRISNDELEMPELVENDIPVRIPLEASRQMIAEFRAENYLKVGFNEISGDSAATAIMKLVQMGNGNVYTDDGLVMHVHAGKEEALKDYIAERQGAPCLIAYHFKHDLDAIKRALIGNVKVLDGSLSAADAEQMQQEWNEGLIPAMCVHPDSAGHGLNLQECHADRILWFSMTYNLDSYDQLNARLCRQGNDAATVFVDRLIAGREDRVIAKALSEKTDVEQALLDSFS